MEKVRFVSIETMEVDKALELINMVERFYNGDVEFNVEDGKLYAMRCN